MSYSYRPIVPYAKWITFISILRNGITISPLHVTPPHYVLWITFYGTNIYTIDDGTCSII